MEAPPRPEAPTAGAPSPVAPAAPPPSAPGPSEAAPPKPRLPIRFEAVPAPVARAEGPHLEIVSPASGDQLSESKAATVPIRLRTSQWSKELALVLVLDDFIPRVFADPAKPIQLAQLLPENRDLEPGRHTLFAAAMLPDGTTIHSDQADAGMSSSFISFWIGDAPSSAGANATASQTSPAIVLVSPRGTYNGDRAADAILVDAHVLGATGPDAPRVKVQIDAALGLSDEQHEAWLTPGKLMKVGGLPSGDHRFSVALVSADEQPLGLPSSAVARTITVNRDAPVE